MCEQTTPVPRGWQGWLPLPEASRERGIGPWSDLTHVLTEELSRSPMFPRPVIRQIMSMPDAVGNLTEIQMVCHHGTHVDAPRHFMQDGPTFDEIPLDRLYGPAVIWRLEKKPHELITAEDLEAARPRMQPGDMILLDTGWAEYINTEHYEEHPSLGIDAADWLLRHQVKLLGVDFGTPDMSSRRRAKGFSFPIHKILLSRGVLIAEHLTNLRHLTNRRVEAMFTALPIAGSDGAPARVLARPLQETAIAQERT